MSSCFLFSKHGPCLILGASALLSAPAAAHVYLNDPNGDEVLGPGSTFTIEWEIAIQHNQNDWDLWYSTTSGTGPWISIVSDLPPGAFAAGSLHTYDWTVPNITAGDVWVRVRMDNSGTDYFDVSDGPFAIGASAAATFRNGSGINSACYTSSLPRIGSTCVIDVDHSAHPGATFTYVLGYMGSASGLVLGAGEVLVDLASPKVCASVIASSGTSDTHSFVIPDDPLLVGRTIATQAAIFGGPGPELCNAIDVVLGF